MTNEQKAVLEFHKLFSHPHPDVLDLSNYRYDLRKKLILEEAREFGDACDARDLNEMIDALADLLYVVYGAAVEMGFDLEPVFYEVHLNNLSKLGPDGKPIYSENGKVLKPEGWKPPDINKYVQHAVDVSEAVAALESVESLLPRTALAQQVLAVMRQRAWEETKPEKAVMPPPSVEAPDSEVEGQEGP